MATYAHRFISAYNQLDQALRNRYNLRANSTFTECVRLSSSRSTVVRKYEDDLMDYGRLRNAIVHKSNTDMVIAEPHESVVLTLEHIVDLISAPPRADLSVAKPAVTLSADTLLIDAIRVMAKGNYSNVPVLRDGVILGVTSNKLIVETLAKNLDRDLDAYLRSATIGSTLTGENAHFVLAKSDVTVDEVLQMFAKSPKLQIVILTHNGITTGNIRGVVTTGDIIAMNRLLD